MLLQARVWLNRPVIARLAVTIVTSGDFWGFDNRVGMTEPVLSEAETAPESRARARLC